MFQFIFIFIRTKIIDDFFRGLKIKEKTLLGCYEDRHQVNDRVVGP